MAYLDKGRPKTDEGLEKQSGARFRTPATAAQKGRSKAATHQLPPHELTGDAYAPRDHWNGAGHPVSGVLSRVVTILEK